MRARPTYHPDLKVEVATMSSPQGLSPLHVLSYEPGVCNIGPEEIARRRRAGHIGLIVSVGLFAVLLVVAAPHWTRLLLVVTAAGSASGYLQAWFHFCAGFGSAGVYNFGPLGTVQRIVDPQARSRDRRKSLQIGLASLAIGLAVGIGAVLLPIR
jgi:ferric-dicitrate binding protein FerR (iron transport regulator)